MNDWTHFLRSEADTLAASTGADTQITPLEHWALLGVQGPDSLKFLQGQLTCDVLALNGERSTLGAHCTHQGRIISSFRAFMTNATDVALSLPADLYESAAQALGKYIVFSKAEIANLSEQFYGIGLKGPQASSLVRAYFGSLPAEQNALVQKDQSVAICLGDDRFECWLPGDQAIEFWRSAAPQCQRGSSEQWTQGHIEAGIPEIHPQTADTFIPQMLNLQFTGGVSFNKGCYTGQEVVARMEFRGKLKRPMYRVSFPLAEGDALPEPGSGLYKLEKDQSIGNIVMAARVSKDRGEALAVLTRSEAEADNAYLNLEKTKKLSLLELPYAINAEE